MASKGSPRAIFGAEAASQLNCALIACPTSEKTGLVGPCWPDLGRTTALNVAAYCVSLNSAPAGQRGNEQIASARGTVYGSEGRLAVLGTMIYHVRGDSRHLRRTHRRWRGHSRS